MVFSFFIYWMMWARFSESLSNPFKRCNTSSNACHCSILIHYTNNSSRQHRLLLFIVSTLQKFRKLSHHVIFPYDIMLICFYDIMHIFPYDIMLICFYGIMLIFSFLIFFFLPFFSVVFLAITVAVWLNYVNYFFLFFPLFQYHIDDTYSIHIKYFFFSFNRLEISLLSYSARRDLSHHIWIHQLFFLFFSCPHLASYLITIKERKES